ncbi:MAG TPA: hypothetical protein DEP82_14565 [Arthrobacter bacterium]|nr:hypothetical protein [Arthrobacter sp.]
MDFIQATYFTPGRQGATVDQIVMHWMDGTLAATIDTFTNGSRQASAHYGIGEGDEKQFVQEGDTAWADGDWNENIRSIAIEHSAQPGRDATDDTYTRSIARVADICSRYGITPSADTILPHKNFFNTDCPGTLDLGRIIAGAQAALNGSAAAPTQPAQPAPAAAAGSYLDITPGPGQCRVDPGDTLSGIAVQFGVDLNALIALNGITEPDKIFPGMLLDLPQAPAAPAAPAGLPPYCTVDPNDTLGGIAVQYGVSLQYILDRNPGINADLIVPGQRINL